MGKDRRNILGQHTVGAQQDCPPGPMDHSANIINQGSREMTRSGDPERAPVFQLRELEGGWSWRRSGEGGGEAHPVPDTPSWGARRSPKQTDPAWNQHSSSHPCGTPVPTGRAGRTQGYQECTRSLGTDQASRALNTSGENRGALASEALRVVVLSLELRKPRAQGGS